MFNKLNLNMRKSVVSTFTLLSLRALLACTFFTSVAGQATVGVKTDLGVYPEGPVPVLSGAGTKINDPVFGTQIMRITDVSDGANYGTAYSYWPTFNLNSTRLIAQSGLKTNLYRFDSTRFELGNKQSMILPPGVGFTTLEDAVWSGVDPETLFVHRGAAFYAFNASTFSYSLLTDLKSQFPAGSYFWQMSVSRDDDVFAFTVKNPDYSVGGYAVWRRSTNKLICSVRTSNLDEVQIDKTGRYLVVKTGLQGAGIIQAKIIDLQSQTVTDLKDNEPDYAPGHSDNGINSVVGADNWQNRITYRNLSDPRSTRTVLSFGNNWDTNFHISLLGDNESWALASFYGNIASGVFNRELVLVATDGSQKVKRIAHHYSQYSTYESSPRANISRDGKFIAFTSNWGGSGRLDLFVAKIPGNTTNALFKNVRAFKLSGTNRLDKLVTSSVASAETAGKINSDGSFSYRYNTVVDSKIQELSVWLDDSQHTFKVVNNNNYLEIWVDGMLQNKFINDITKIVKIERSGGAVKIWQNDTLLYASSPQFSTGAASFKVRCVGNSALANVGIKGIRVRGMSY